MQGPHLVGLLAHCMDETEHQRRRTLMLGATGKALVRAISARLRLGSKLAENSANLHPSGFRETNVWRRRSPCKKVP